MLMRILLVWTVIAALSTATASAVDLAKIDRKIAKEPAYASKAPSYALLVFGPEAKSRVWLVLDGDALYVDRNGNGDLTEPGERISVKTPNQDPASFEEVEILGGDGQKTEKLRFALYGWFDYKAGKKPGEESVTVSWQGRWYGAWGDEHSGLVFAARPEDAPVLHVGGPLYMGFESRLQHVWVKKGADAYEINIGVGTPGVGKGSFVHLTYWDDAIPKDAYPEADFEFPNRERGGPPIRFHAVLKGRC